MHPKSIITLAEACELLGVSRPTLNAYRDEYGLREVRVQRHKKLYKKEIFEKIYAKVPPLKNSINLMMSHTGLVEDLLVDESSFDLRLLNTIDGFGILGLLSKIRNLVAQGHYVYLLASVDTPGMIPILCKLGFFKEIRRQFKTQVEWNEEAVRIFDKPDDEGLLPIKYIGVRGQEKEFIKELSEALKIHGFSGDLCSYISWVLGELADNSHTHAKGPCYFLIDKFSDENKYLEVSMVDSGVGIEKSLKTNPKYKDLSELHALLLAFKSKVSSWPDEAERGKGLSDILKIAMGNRGYFRVESNDLAIFMNFQDFKTEVTKTKCQVSTSGTRFAIMFIDSSFELPTRQVADEVIEKRMRELI